MNLLDLTPGQALLLDVIALTVLGVGIGYLGHRLPERWLQADRGPLRLAPFERCGTWYERRLAVKRWKDRLPEAGAVFAGGTPKRKLADRSPEGLARFATETRRAELVHLALLAVSPTFLLVNPWLLGSIIAAYSVVANLPCLVVQRYNRARIARILPP